MRTHNDITNDQALEALARELAALERVAPEPELTARIKEQVMAQTNVIVRKRYYCFTSSEIGGAFLLCALAHVGIGFAQLLGVVSTALPLAWSKLQPPLALVAAALFLVSAIAFFYKARHAAAVGAVTILVYLTAVLCNAFYLHASLPSYTIITPLVTYQLAALALGVLLLLALNRFQNEPSHKRYRYEA